jgi:hypothetical protein
MNSMCRACASSVGAIALVAVAVGCSSRPYGTVPVRGRVTFSGKQPPARCEVYFVPVETEQETEVSFAPRPAVGYADATGAFEVTSFRPGDGLLPGTYEVRIECWRATPQTEHGVASGRPATSFVPAGFQPPRLVVPAEGRSSVRYDIDVSLSPHETSAK